MEDWDRKLTNTMIIEELKDTKNDNFVAFKKKEWVYADKEHYGDIPPDLTKYETRPSMGAKYLKSNLP